MDCHRRFVFAIKFAALLIGASFCARAAHTRLGWDLAQPLLLALFIPLALLLNQPDVGSFLLIITVSIAMLFLAGLKLRWFAGGLLVFGAIFGAVVAAKPYILSRFVSFGNPLDDRKTAPIIMLRFR